MKIIFKKHNQLCYPEEQSDNNLSDTAVFVKKILIEEHRP